MKPPPPMFPAAGYVTARANAVATVGRHRPRTPLAEGPAEGRRAAATFKEERMSIAPYTRARFAGAAALLLGLTASTAQAQAPCAPYPIPAKPQCPPPATLP